MTTGCEPAAGAIMATGEDAAAAPPGGHADHAEPRVATAAGPAAGQTAERPATPGSGDAGNGFGTDWWPHENGRWVVGDAGSQPRMIAVPASVAARRPDTTCDGARLGDLDYRAVSLRGLAHGEAGKPRQDAYLLRISSNRQWLVGCVSDGVSDGHLSHIAADVACLVITRELADALGQLPAVTEPGIWAALVSRLPWQEAVDRANAAIVGRANAVAAAGNPASASGPQLAQPLDERGARKLMATTAVAFVVGSSQTPDGLVPYALAVACGDSSALLLSGGLWHPLTGVKNAGGDIASNEVRALPRAVQVRPLSGFLGPGEALAVISDGIGDSLGRGTGVVGRFLADQWARPPDLFAFASQAAFYRKTFTDDRTAVVVWHRPRPMPRQRDADDDEPAPATGEPAHARPGTEIHAGPEPAQAEPAPVPGEAGPSDH